MHDGLVAKEPSTQERPFCLCQFDARVYRNLRAIRWGDRRKLRTSLFLEKTRQKEPGGAFEPFGLSDPPGRFVVWPMAQHEPSTLERRPRTTPLHARAIRKSPGSRMFRSHPTGAQCWQRGTLCCCSGCSACSCCVWRNGCCSACCSRNRHEGHGHLAVGPTNIVPHNKSFRNRQVSA